MRGLQQSGRGPGEDAPAAALGASLDRSSAPLAASRDGTAPALPAVVSILLILRSFRRRPGSLLVSAWESV